MTQADVPAHLAGKVEIGALSPRDIMAACAEKGWRGVYVDGGALVQSFLREGLIHAMTITTAPVLIGDGIRLFGDLPGDVDLRLERSTAHPSGLVTSRYHVVRAA